MSIRPIVVSLFLILTVQLLSWVAACQPAEQLKAASLSDFAELSVAQESVDPASIDYALLSEAIFHETNLHRSQNDLEHLAHLTGLDRAACTHAEEMVANDFFAHLNPNDPSLETPADRLRAQSLEVGFVAENIGEVFVLDYESGERVYTRERDGRTIFSREPGGDPLGRRSYLEVAESLLDSWMASPGHRSNILSPEAKHFGSGCQVDEAEQLSMPMLSCVQLFFAPLGGSLD